MSDLSSPQYRARVAIEKVKARLGVEPADESDRLSQGRLALWQLIEAVEALLEVEAIPRHGADRHNQFDHQYAAANHGHLKEDIG